MKNEEYPKLFSREWLNKDDGGGYIIVEASNEPNYALKDCRHLFATVEIKDCSRQVRLDFQAYEEKELQARIDKINLIINKFEELKAFMLANPPVDANMEDKEVAKSINKMLNSKE